MFSETFQGLFMSRGLEGRQLDLNNIHVSTLSLEQQCFLCTDVTEAEIKHAVQDMHPTKASDPDYFSMQFYQ